MRRSAHRTRTARAGHGSGSGTGFTGHIAAGDLSAIENVRRPGVAEGDTAYYRYVVIACAVMFLLALLHVSRKPGRAPAARPMTRSAS